MGHVGHQDVEGGAEMSFNDDSDLDWDGEPEEPRAAEDRAVADAAIQALRTWKERIYWRNQEVDHQHKGLARLREVNARLASENAGLREALNNQKGFDEAVAAECIRLLGKAMEVPGG